MSRTLQDELLSTSSEEPRTPSPIQFPSIESLVSKKPTESQTDQVVPDLEKSPLYQQTGNPPRTIIHTVGPCTVNYHAPLAVNPNPFYWTPPKVQPSPVVPPVWQPPQNLPLEELQPASSLIIYANSRLRLSRSGHLLQIERLCHCCQPSWTYPQAFTGPDLQQQPPSRTQQPSPPLSTNPSQQTQATAIDRHVHFDEPCAKKNKSDTKKY